MTGKTAEVVAKTINTMIEEGTLSVYCNGLRVNKAWAIQNLENDSESFVTLTAERHAEPFIYDPLEDSLNLVLKKGNM